MTFKIEKLKFVWSAAQKTVKHLGRWLISQPLRCLAVLLILVCFYAAAVFYFYTFKNQTISGPTTNLKINSELAQKVIDRLEQRNSNIQQLTGKNYRDIFR